MSNNSQSVKVSAKQLDPEGYAAGITSLARCARSLRTVKAAGDRYVSVETDGAIERRGAVYGPLTAEQAEFDEDMRAEIARQDANPDAYVIRYSSKKIAEVFGVSPEVCEGLGYDD